MSKLLHLTRPGFVQSLSQGHLGVADPVHDLIRCARNPEDGDDIYAGADVNPKAPRVDRASDFSSLLVRARDGDDEAVKSLGNLDDGRVHGALISLLRDSESEVIEAACRELAKHPSVSAVVPLVNLMAKSPAGIDIDLPMDALAAVGEDAVPILLHLLSTSENGGVREQSAYALSERYSQSELLSKDEGRNILISALGDPVPDVVVSCIHLLAGLQHFEPLVGLLTHSDLEIRQEAGRVLSMIDRERAAVEFVRVLGNANVAKDAANQLVAMGEPATKALVDGFAGAGTYKRERIRVALGKIVSSSGAGPTLYMRDRFGDPDVDIRRGVLRTLLDITLRYLPIAVKDVFRDSDAVIRMMLVERMKAFGGPEYISALESLNSDPDEGVREGAAEAIRLIQQREQERVAAEAAQERQAAEQAAQQEAQQKAEVVEKKAEVERREVQTRIEAVTQGLIVSLSTMLGLKYNLRASAMKSEYVHASVLAFEEDEASSEPQSKYAKRILPAITVDVGPTAEYAREVLKTLNFLVHHEIAHAHQIQRKLPEPEIEVERFKHLEHKYLAHYANEMFMDRLAFDMGVKMYVHGDGDAVFDAETREIIVIGALNMLATLMNSDADERGREIIDPAVARLVATLRESAMSRVITRNTQASLRAEANKFYDRAIRDTDAGKTAEFNRLIKEYRSIFRNSSLEV